MANEKILDCQGLACPQPVLQTKDTLEEMAVGEQLLVVVDNEGSCSNVRRFAESQGHQVSFEEKDGNFHIRIQKRKDGSESEAPEIVCDTPQKKSLVVYISSETMGQGDDELGRILMKVYLDTLSHFAKDISHIIFVNAGVKLAVEDSPVLENIQELEHVGAEVLSCGACLNHFGITDKLAVGSVSNMYTILEVQAKAGTLLSP